jgi:predicted nucleic acid binding AN1-type Zn finger protein
MMNTRDIINMKIKEKKTEVNNLKTNLSETEISDTKKREHDLINNTSGEFGEGKKPKSQFNSCAKCNKKLKLTDSKCKCNNYYCSAHRYSDTHNCSFDYKKHGREYLEKQNPIIKFNKLDKM